LPPSHPAKVTFQGYSVDLTYLSLFVKNEQNREIRTSKSGLIDQQSQTFVEKNSSVRACFM